MLDVIKTEKLNKDEDISLVYFYNIKGYEVQYSYKDHILDTRGIYSNKKEGLKEFKIMKKEININKL